MKKVRLYVTFLDGTEDAAVGDGLLIESGMLIVDFGPTKGQAGYNILALKSWSTEVEYV